MEIVVFLHVHIDKHLRIAARCFFIEWTQALFEPLHRTVDVPLVKLSHHGGGFHGNVGHARILDELEGTLSTGFCLSLTEYRFTQ